MHPAYRAGELPGSGVLFPYAEMVGRPLSHVDPSVSLTADSSPYQGEPLLGTGDADCHDQRVRWSRNDRLQEARCKSRRGDVGIAPYEM